MGIGVNAQCECGYEGSASIASSRAGHGQYFSFPHWCRSCNEVVTLDVLAESPACRKCGGADVHSYEARTTRLPFRYPEFVSQRAASKFGWHGYEEELNRSWCYSLQKHFVLLRQGNYCPMCKENSLKFYVEMYFD